MKRSSGVSQDVIDISDDESTNEQPAEKIVKMEEELVHSPEVVELQQKVAKLEKDYQCACVYARKLELEKEDALKRVEFLENLLDKKRATKDDDMDNEPSTQLFSHEENTDLRQKVDKLETEKQNLIRMTSEAQARVEFLENLIDKKPATIDDKDMNLIYMQKKIDELSNERDEMVRKLAEIGSSEKHQERIEDIDEGGQKQNLIQTMKTSTPRDYDGLFETGPSPHRAAPIEAAHTLTCARVRMFDQSEFDKPRTDKRGLMMQLSYPTSSAGEIWYSNNILQVYRRKCPNSVSRSHAHMQLSISEMKARLILGYGSEEWGKALKKLFSGEKSFCTSCKETFENEQILTHFYSDEHARLVSRSSYVPLAAFFYWNDKLESITKKPITSAIALCE